MTRHDLTSLTRILRGLAGTLRRAPTSDVVDIGHRLDVALQELHLAREVVKDVLREHAKPKLTGNTRSVTLQGTEGSATVTAEQPILRMAPGADVTSLQRQLGGAFSQLFILQAQPRQDVFTRLQDFPPDVQQIVFANVTQDFGVGSVGFSKR